MEKKISITISQKDLIRYTRLDQFLSARIDDTSRSKIKELFKTAQITFSPTCHQGKESNCSQEKLILSKMPKSTGIITIKYLPPQTSVAFPQNIPLNILFEDEHLAFIDKPEGLVVHPGAGNTDNTLANALAYHFKNIMNVGHPLRPGIVHRLDKGTSGVLVIAKNQKTYLELVKIFSNHTLERIYKAICFGSPLKLFGTIESHIGRDPKNRLKMMSHPHLGQLSITHFEKQKSLGKHLSMLKLKLETGRTHQIRVHLKSDQNSPILFDDLYANVNQQLTILGDQFKEAYSQYPYPMLHAQSLSFTHPITGESLSFQSPLPLRFQKIIKIANNCPNKSDT